MNKTFLTFLFAGLMAFAGSALGDASLGSRMKERLPKIVAAKDAGTVGEGADGLLHARPGSDDGAAKLAKAENGDRKAYFALVARKIPEGSASAVAKRVLDGYACRVERFRSQPIQPSD